MINRGFLENLRLYSHAHRQFDGQTVRRSDGVFQVDMPHSVGA